MVRIENCFRRVVPAVGSITALMPVAGPRSCKIFRSLELGRVSIQVKISTFPPRIRPNTARNQRSQFQLIDTTVHSPLTVGKPRQVDCHVVANSKVETQRQAKIDRHFLALVRREKGKRAIVSKALGRQVVTGVQISRQDGTETRTRLRDPPHGPGVVGGASALQMVRPINVDGISASGNSPQGRYNEMRRCINVTKVSIHPSHLKIARIPSLQQDWRGAVGTGIGNQPAASISQRGENFMTNIGRNFQSRRKLDDDGSVLAHFDGGGSKRDSACNVFTVPIGRGRGGCRRPPRRCSRGLSTRLLCRDRCWLPSRTRRLPRWLSTRSPRRLPCGSFCGNCCWTTRWLTSGLPSGLPSGLASWVRGLTSGLPTGLPCGLSTGLPSWRMLKCRLTSWLPRRNPHRRFGRWLYRRLCTGLPRRNSRGLLTRLASSTWLRGWFTRWLSSWSGGTWSRVWCGAGGSHGDCRGRGRVLGWACCRLPCRPSRGSSRGLARWLP